MRVFNFSAGPAVLPEEVLAKAAAEMLDWHGSGMSVMEMSHRGKEFISIADKTEADLRKLLAIPANYKVLLLQGGAIAENAIVPMNLLGGHSVADYVNTGEWSKKSIKEAKKYCSVNIAASSEDKDFTYIPPQAAWKLSRDAAYVHVCTNETIGGIEYQWTPDTGDLPLVADMSSHILSRPIDVSKFGVIYGGAQKNAGPAGLTLVIVRDELLDRAMPITPSAFHWKEQAAADSMLNTPPTYAIYIAGLVFEWLQAEGGIAAIEKKNIEKAALLYDYLDTTEFYRNPAREEDRSRMNIVFRLKDESLDDAFLKGAKAAGMDQLKGHRSVGGMRASIYNAMPIAGVRALVDYMKAFESATVEAREAMSKYQILTLNQISSHGLERFPDARYLVGKTVENPDAILVRSHDMHKMDIPPSVKAIGRAGAGTNNIPMAAMSKRGVPVFNAPGANANAVKELVLAALLLAARNVMPALEYVAALNADQPDLDKRVEDGKKQFAGIELPQRTLGIVGLGAIGSLVADTAIKLGMKVTGFDPEITVDAAWRLSSSVRRANSIEELLKQSDFVTLHVPLVAATRNLIDGNRLAVMKQGAVLLNFARDALIDESAVVAALRERKLKYYVCDFPSATLIREPNVVALPHLGASTEEAEENCAVMVVDQVREYLENGALLNAVNFPNVEMARESPFRVAIANANVPNMVGQISTTLAHAGLNIHNMVNKSRGEMAYTLVDVDSPVQREVIDAIGRIGGVLSVRAIPQEHTS